MSTTQFFLILFPTMWVGAGFVGLFLLYKIFKIPSIPIIIHLLTSPRLFAMACLIGPVCLSMWDVNRYNYEWIEYVTKEMEMLRRRMDPKVGKEKVKE